MRWAVLWVTLLALILVPFYFFEDRVNAIAERVVLGGNWNWTTAGALAGLLASDVFLPIPSSIVSAAAGALLGFWRGAAVIWIGMMAACLVGYGFGAWMTAAARRWVGESSAARGQALARRYGDYAIIFCRPIPVLAEASVILAGMARTSIARFLNFTAWSNLGIALAYAAIGAFAMTMESFLLAFAGSLVLPGLAMLAARRWLRVPAKMPEDQ